MSDIDERVGKLEQNHVELRAGQDHLYEEMKGLKTSLKEFTDDMREAISALTTKFTDSQRVPWAIVISSVSVGLGIAAMLATVIYSDIHRNEDAIAAIVADAPTRQEFHLMRETMSLEIDILELKIPSGE